MLICPKHPYVLVRKDDPSVRVPKPCGSYQCETCLPAKLAERTRVMTWGATNADHVRLLTLTLLPQDWQRARMQVRDLVRRVRKRFKLEIAWAIEANPRGTGHHAHGVTHGEFIPGKEIQRMWGGRHVDIRLINPGVSGYATKCAMVSGYLTKNTQTHLTINGGRAVHMSRGFLHGLTAREVQSVLSKGHEWRVGWATAQERLTDHQWGPKSIPDSLQWDNGLE